MTSFLETHIYDTESNAIALGKKEKNTMKVTKFTAKQGNETYQWAFWRDPNANLWFLRDCDGYVRTLERTWIDSVPRINLTLENYGMDRRFEV